MSFSTFNGAAGEDAQEFLDNLEIACLVTGRDDDATRSRVLPLLMKAEAKAWFNTLLPANRGDWAGLRVLFLAKFGGGGETSESLWGKVCELRQGSLFEYNVYELQFVELWERWVASLRLGEAASDFLKKDRFVAGLCPPLREKVKGRFPVTWMDARDIARLKERKIRYQLQQREADQEEEGMAPVPPTNAPAAHRGQGLVMAIICYHEFFPSIFRADSMGPHSYLQIGNDFQLKLFPAFRRQPREESISAENGPDHDKENPSKHSNRDTLLC
ncbi:hypothetical protein L7F22_064144 [Adiantum nelumboides]|nr:hypothetical protein [Adiantum nelumboides]